MITKSALDITTLLRSLRKAPKPSVPAELDEYYKRIARTANPQYAERVGKLLNDKLMSVTKTAEDSAILPALAAGGIGAGAGAALMSMLKAREGNHMLKRIRRGAGIAAGLPALIMAGMHTSKAIKPFLKKASDDTVVLPAALLAGGALGAVPMAHIMDRRNAALRRKAYREAVRDIVLGKADIPAGMAVATSGLSNVGSALDNIPELLKRLSKVRS